MPCWLCKAGILVAIIALLLLVAQIGAVAAAATNAFQALLLALAYIGLDVSPAFLAGILGFIAGFSANAAAGWLCCKLGVTACCD